MFVDSRPSPNTFSFAEFFSGIGLVRLGLERSGFHCLFANEIDARKNAIYTKNFGSAELFPGDIASLTSEMIPAAELFTASFPCQDLSLAGERAGLKGKRSGLVLEFLRLLSGLRDENRAPKMILLENVPGLLTSHGGSDIRQLLTCFNQLGYACDLFLVDAVHFLPQSRPRVFIVGLCDQQLKNSASNPNHPCRPITIQKVIAHNPTIHWHHLELPDLPPSNEQSLTAIWETGAHLNWFDDATLEREFGYIRNGSLERLQRALQQARATQSTVHLTAYRRMRSGQVCLETRNDGIAGCLRPATGGSSRQVVIEVNSSGDIRMRYMTAREYARLQGVGDHFWIPDRQSVGLSAFGDAVTVPVLSWIGETLKLFLGTVQTSPQSFVLEQMPLPFSGT
jgi:DNA (cytosine-5)-methyltransferase 1